MGHVDPLKEVKAAAERIALSMTTAEQEASEYNGNDWDANVRQRKKEIAATADLLAASKQRTGKENEDE